MLGKQNVCKLLETCSVCLFEDNLWRHFDGHLEPCCSHPSCRFSCYSKMNADKRVESPIPILPLPTPDVETEKLIKMKDEEVSA